MAKMNPCIHFLGNANEAMTHYAEMFGGELTLVTYNTHPMPNLSDVDQHLLMHARLRTSGGMDLMGADVPSVLDYDDGARIHASTSGTTHEEEILRAYWDRLADGGVVTMPLAGASWGSAFGAVTDRFGVRWFVNIGDVAP